MIDLSIFQELFGTMAATCPDLMANYGDKIWDACAKEHANLVFNECTATIIAIGISIVAGAMGWSVGSSSSGGSASSGSSGGTSSGSGHRVTDPGYDTVLADNLPPDLRTYDSIADFYDITSWGQE